jgi:hypothetical protein
MNPNSPDTAHSPSFSFDLHLLSVRLRTIDLLARLLDLLQHGVVGEGVVGVDFCGLRFQVHGVGLDAWKGELGRGRKLVVDEGGEGGRREEETYHQVS